MIVETLIEEALKLAEGMEPLGQAPTVSESADCAARSRPPNSSPASCSRKLIRNPDRTCEIVLPLYGRVFAT